MRESRSAPDNAICRRPTKEPPFRKRGVGGIYTHTYTYTPPRTAASRPPPSFRRRPESRTPVVPGVSIGEVWIPAFAGMTGWGGNDDGVGRRDMALAGARRSSLTQPSPAGRGLSGACAVYKVGRHYMALASVYRRGARPCAPTPHHDTRPAPRNPPNPLPRILSEYIATKPYPPSNGKPSPSGRGLGEGESLYARQRHLTPPTPSVILAPIPSFPRKRESTPRPFRSSGLAGVLDSGRRRNDGGGG